MINSRSDRASYKLKEVPVWQKGESVRKLGKKVISCVLSGAGDVSAAVLGVLP